MSRVRPSDSLNACEMLPLNQGRVIRSDPDSVSVASQCSISVISTPPADPFPPTWVHRGVQLASVDERSFNFCCYLLVIAGIFVSIYDAFKKLPRPVRFLTVTLVIVGLCVGFFFIGRHSVTTQVPAAEDNLTSATGVGPLSRFIYDEDRPCPMNWPRDCVSTCSLFWKTPESNIYSGQMRYLRKCCEKCNFGIDGVLETIATSTSSVPMSTPSGVLSSSTRVLTPSTHLSTYSVSESKPDDEGEVATDQETSILPCQTYAPEPVRLISEASTAVTTTERMATLVPDPITDEDLLYSLPSEFHQVTGTTRDCVLYYLRLPDFSFAHRYYDLQQCLSGVTSGPTGTRSITPSSLPQAPTRSGLLTAGATHSGIATDA